MLQALVDTAVGFWRSGQPAQAIPLLRRALADQPGHAGLLLLLGCCAGAAETPEAGLRALSRALRLDPTMRENRTPADSQIAALLDQALLDALDALADGQRDRALALCQAASRLELAQTALFVELMQTLLTGGHADCDSAASRRVVDICFTRGRLAAHGGDHAAAGQWFRRAIREEPRHFYLYHFLGEALSAAGRPFEALDAYRRAQTTHGADVPSLLKIASLESLFGYHGRALDAAQLCLSLTDNCDASYILGVSHYHIGDLAAAEAALTRVAGESRLAPNCAFFLSLIALQRGDYERALQLAQANFTANHNPFAGFVAAQAAQALGQRAAADGNAAFAAEKLAQIRERCAEGRFPEAAEACQAALLVAPQDTDITAATRALCQNIHDAIASGRLDALHCSYYWSVAQGMEAVARYVKLVATTTAARPPAAVRAVKIWDGFIFNDELDLLRCRIDELSDVVDYFVLVESCWTFRGAAKPLTFAANIDRFSDVAHRIRHVVVDSYCHGLPWDHEAYQRNSILRGLAGAADDDIAIIADIDELPRPETLAMLRRSPDIAGRLNGLAMQNFKYYLNLQLYQTLVRSATAPCGLLRRMGPNYARWLLNRNGMQIASVLNDAGWHFSSLGGAAAAMKKYHEDSHVEKTATAPTQQELERLLRRARRDADGQALRTVPIDASYPAFVRNHLSQMRALGWVWEG